MKANEIYFKKLSIYMRNQLISLFTIKCNDDELNSKQILSFVIFTDYYDQQYIR